MKRAALSAALVASLALTVAGAPAARAATTRPCPGGEAGTTCHVWTGKAHFIGDGDTLRVDVKGDGTRTAYSVRITGIQAMEEHVYTSRRSKRKGECHANRATARLEELVRGSRRRVRLAAQDPASHSRERLRRTVAVRRHGRWIDVGSTLVREGHALFLANDREWAWNRKLSTLAQRASTRGAELWNPEQCSRGPDAQLRVTAFVDPDGPDVGNEWVRIENLDAARPIALGRWWLRDSGLRRYTIPAGTVVPPGGSVTVWVGGGADRAGDLHWQSPSAVFDNPSDEHGRGDGAYLFDPDGDLRAAMQYPCRYACQDPLAGAVELNASYLGHEFVSLRNDGAAPVDLDGYRLESEPHAYAFGPDSVLQPGEWMLVFVNGSPVLDDHRLKHWGESRQILANDGDHVALTRLDYVPVACVAWGDGYCATPRRR